MPNRKQAHKTKKVKIRKNRATEKRIVDSMQRIIKGIKGEN